MLSKLQKRNNKGFTIIEVMIVLAIAALILLIVFLAVPALQRSTRNTQRKNDAARVGSAADTVVSNNNGDLTALTTANLRTEVGNNTLSYYDTTKVSVTAALTTGTTLNNTTSADTVKVVPDAMCSGTNAAYKERGVAILYSTENGNAGATHVCLND